MFIYFPEKMENLPESLKKCTYFFIQLYTARLGSGSGGKGPDPTGYGSATLVPKPVNLFSYFYQRLQRGGKAPRV